MKIIYLLRKGLHFYPPCLTQILTLNDYKYEIEVYHGNNSKYIDELLDDRGIIHYTFETDRYNKNRLESALNFISLGMEARKVQSSLDKDAILWLGNLETAMSLNGSQLKKHKFILNVLELYDEHTIYDNWLKKYIKNASVVVACEKHRAAIMQCRYNLKELPVVIPNKSYDVDIKNKIQDDSIIKSIKTNFIVVYQGIISEDRPLDKVAKALALLGDKSIVFLIMGKCDERYKSDLKKIYSNILFTGYVPAPQHLLYTQYCNIGIANYDKSLLNNVFCAPNKIYEYTKYRIPILCSDNIALEETIGEARAGICLDFLDEDIIMKAIQEIKDNYDTYSVNAKEFYCSLNVEKKINDIICRVC